MTIRDGGYFFPYFFNLFFLTPSLNFNLAAWLESAGPIKN